VANRRESPGGAVEAVVAGSGTRHGVEGEAPRGRKGQIPMFDRWLPGHGERQGLEVEGVGFPDPPVITVLPRREDLHPSDPMLVGL